MRENLRGLRENLKQKNPIPSRQLAESSPYFEALREKEVEILFCYEPYDELVLMQLQQFDKKKMTSVEKVTFIYYVSTCIAQNLIYYLTNFSQKPFGFLLIFYQNKTKILTLHFDEFFML